MNEEDKKSKRTWDFIVKLDNYDIMALKQRPRRGVFSHELADAVVDKMVADILEQAREHCMDYVDNKPVCKH